jgi:hypothetical protein
VSLTYAEALASDQGAVNLTRAYHDEWGVDWEHWHLYPGSTDPTDGHHHSPAAYPAWPMDGWVHDVGCTCPLSPRCHQGEHGHGGKDPARKEQG